MTALASPPSTTSPLLRWALVIALAFALGGLGILTVAVVLAAGADPASAAAAARVDAVIRSLVDMTAVSEGGALTVGLLVGLQTARRSTLRIDPIEGVSALVDAPFEEAIAVIGGVASREASATALADAVRQLTSAPSVAVVALDDGTPTILATSGPAVAGVSGRVTSIAADPERQERPRRWVDATGEETCAVMTAPVRSGDEVVAVVCAVRSGSHPFGLGDLDAMCRLAEAGMVSPPPLVDDVTHLPTRRRLDLDLAAAGLAADADATPMPVGYLAVSIDHAATRRHVLGPVVADALLAEVAEIVRVNLREDDVLFRDGDDRFGALLAGADAWETADAAERVRAAVEAHDFTVDDEPMHLTVSVGTVVALDGATSAMFERAEQALDVAERYGRNRVMPSLG